jgi:phenylpropionate dioxygenase-like ring-hydroxylating dioxygenase large terminal subunit
VTATRIPAELYTERAAFEREHDRLWPRAWLMAAHRGELADGDLRVAIGRDEVILSLAPHGAPVARTADASTIRCQAWAGFAWICLADDAPDLHAYLGDLLELVACYRLEEWGLEVALTTELECNWKASVDAHNESYHVHSLHTEVLGFVEDTACRIDFFGDHSRIVVPMGRGSRRLAAGKRATLSAPMRALLAAEGVDATPHASDPEEARRALQRARRRRLGPGLSDDQLSDSHQFFVFPNLHINASADETMVMRHRPDARDPQRMLFDFYVLRRSHGKRGRGGARRRTQVARSDPGFGPVTGADLALLPELGRGMRSRGFRGLHLSTQEACIAHMHQAIARWLDEGDRS